MIDIDHLKALNPLSKVVGQICSLRRSGAEWVGCCPLHDDSRPSLYLNGEKGVFYCHGCNAAGDVIQFVMAHHGVCFADAVALLDSGAKLGTNSLPRVPKVTGRRDTGGIARSIWDAGGSIAGTPAERYLCNRGLDLGRLPPLPALRFDRLSYRGMEGKHPALIAGVSAPSGEIVSIQRVYLTEDGRKLDVPDPKRSLGPRPGGAIRLGCGLTDLIICEGLEDGLSILFDMPDQTVWVAAGANMMRSIVLPDECRSVVIARDNDEAGERAAEEAAAAFLAAGRTVHVMAPPPGYKDFNEMVSKRSMQ